VVITIDGPAASGKSTVAKRLAKRLNFYYLYTGLFYRAVAYILLEKLGVNLGDFENLREEDLSFVSNIEYSYKNNEPHIFYKGEDITISLKLPNIDQPASIVSANESVRKAILCLQRNVAKRYNIVADGRDCGSVIFPNADYKFFLTASLDVRAKRKVDEVGVDFDIAKEELATRDQRDKRRKISPLIIPSDAIVIDNSNLDREETLERFLKEIKVGK
jgi:cytidylate kinase